MNSQLEMIRGYEDIGLRFYLGADASVKMMVPENITLAQKELDQLKELKPDILRAIGQGVSLL